MDQQTLFFEDIYQVLTHACHAIGGNKNNWAQCVGQKLWPEKSKTDSGIRLANCLNKERAEKLDPEQVILIARMAREIGCHVVMAFIAKECLYRPPDPITPEEQISEKQTEFVQAVETLGQIMLEMRKVTRVA